MYKIHYLDNNKATNAELICNNFDKNDVVNFFQDIIDLVLSKDGTLLPNAFKHYVLIVNDKYGDPEAFMYATDFTFRRQLMENVHNSLPNCNTLYFAGFSDIIVAHAFAQKSLTELEMEKLKSFL